MAVLTMAVAMMFAPDPEIPVRLAARLLDSAAEIARKSPNATYEITQIADLWRPRDKAKARRLLVEEWKKVRARKDSDVDQRDLVESCAAVDISMARDWAYSIKGREERSFALRFLTPHRAIGDPASAGRAMRDRRDGADTGGAAYDLMSAGGADDVLKFCNQLKPGRRDNVLAGVVEHYMDDDVDGALMLASHIKNKDEREEAIGIGVGRMALYNRSRAVELLPKVTKLTARIAALAGCADAYRFSNPEKAKELGAEAVRLIAKLPPKSDDRQAMEARHYLALGRVKAPGLEALLQQWLDRDPESYRGELVGTWAHYDIKQAEKLFKPDGPKSEFYTGGCFPASMMEWYAEYLSGLVEVDPERALRYVKNLGNPAYKTDNFIDNAWIDIDRVFEAILHKPEKVVRPFIEAYGFEKITQAYESRLLARNILKDPKAGISRLKELPEEAPRTWGARRQDVVLEVARRLLPDLTLANEALATIEDRAWRIQTTAELARLAYKNDRTLGMSLFETASEEALKLKYKHSSRLQLWAAEEIIEAIGSSWKVSR